MGGPGGLAERGSDLVGESFEIKAYTTQHRETLVASLEPTCGAICKGLSLQAATCTQQVLVTPFMENLQ
eukprot:1944536-Amphidinium_carterae.1